MATDMSDPANEKRKIAFLNANDVLNETFLLPAATFSETPVSNETEP
jgi:hypothetical protein